MICRVVNGKSGNIAIICSRGEPRVMCSECKTRRATRTCEFELLGALAGKKCSRPLCDRCAVERDDGAKVCGPHAKWVRPDECGDKND